MCLDVAAREKGQFNLGREPNQTNRPSPRRQRVVPSSHVTVSPVSLRASVLGSGKALISFRAATMSEAAETISVASPADFHVHLRQGELAQVVTPHVRQGGFSLAYVMARLLARSLQMAPSHRCRAS